MKKSAVLFSLLVVLLFSVFAFPASADSTAIEIDELNMSIAVPNDMLSATRSSKKTDVYFAKFGLDYDKIMEGFKEQNIYLQAMKRDSSLTLQVTMTQNEDSRKIGNYANATDAELATVKEELRADKNCKSVTQTTFNGIKYFVLEMRTKSGKKSVQAQQYNTVINGENIVISLQASVGEKLTEADRDSLATIVSETNILENNFFTAHKELFIIGGLILIGVIAVVVILIIVLRKLRRSRPSNKRLVHELAHEHNITDTSEFPRRSIDRITQHTDSFMRNYAPVDEIEPDDGQKLATEEDAREATRVAVPHSEKEQSVAAEIPSQAVAESSPFDEELSDVVVQSEIPKPLGAEDISGNAVPLFSKKDEEAVEVSAAPEEIADDSPEELVDINETVQPEEHFDEAADYFDDVPSEDEMYSYDNVGDAVREYSAAERRAEEANYEDYSVERADIKGTARKAGEIALKVLKAIGRGIVIVFSTIWTIICFIVIHCKYFCINLSREIKRSRARKKRAKAEEARRRSVSEQRRAQREAERQRQRRNASRGENDLVQVRSHSERPVNRTPRR